MSHVVSHVITWRARGHVIGHVCSHGHMTGRSHLITCVLTVTCASDEQVRHSYRLYRPRIVKEHFSPGADVDWFYFCRAREAMVPLPPGHKPILDGEDDM